MKVTVQAAAAAPKSSPLSPMTPLGMSTAMMGSLRRVANAKVSLTCESKGPRKPDPNMESTTNSALSMTGGVSGSISPVQRSA